MIGTRPRLLISLGIAFALTLAGIMHAPMAVARLAVMAAPVMQMSCHGEAARPHEAPAAAHPGPDCCLMLCSSLPSVAQATAQPVEYAAAGYVVGRPAPLAARVLSPDPGPPRA